MGSTQSTWGTIKKNKQTKSMKAITILLIALAINASMSVTFVGIQKADCHPCALAGRNLDAAREGIAREGMFDEAVRARLSEHKEKEERDAREEKRNLVGLDSCNWSGCLVHQRVDARRMLGVEGAPEICCPQGNGNSPMCYENMTVSLE